MYFLSIATIFTCLSTSKVHMVSLVSIFYQSTLNCVQLRCVLSFNFSTSQGSLVSLICQRSNLVLLLPLPLPFSPVPSQISGRDPLVVVECCNAPRPELRVSPMISGFRHVICWFVAFIIASCALHHVIMPSCHLIFKTQPSKLHGSSIYLNRGNSHGDFSL